MEFWEYRVVKRLMLYVPPVLVVLGTFGNILSFMILRRRVMLKVSSYHYLAVLAVADSLVLYVGLMRLWLGELTGYDLHDSSHWLCKVTISIGYSASDLSVWLIIAVTVERYIVVCFPLHASTVISTRRAKWLIGCLTLLMFGINLHFLWTVEIVEQPVKGMNVGYCEAAPHYQYLVNDVWPWIDAFIYSFVPFIVIIILNILIILEVVEARAHRLRLQSTPQHHYHSRTPRFRRGIRHQTNNNMTMATGCRRSCGPGEGLKLTVMLLTVSFTFLMTTLPMNVCLIVTAFWQVENHTLKQTMQLHLAKTIAELLMYVNHSINFGLYCATGHKFRQQIVYLLRCKKETNTQWNSFNTDDIRYTSSVKNGNNTVRLSDNQQGLELNLIQCKVDRKVDPNRPLSNQFSLT